MSSRPTAVRALLERLLHESTSDADRITTLRAIRKLDPKLTFLSEVGQTSDRAEPKHSRLERMQANLHAKNQQIEQHVASIAALEKHQAQTDARLTKMVAENAALKSRLKSKPD